MLLLSWIDSGTVGRRTIVVIGNLHGLVVIVDMYKAAAGVFLCQKRDYSHNTVNGAAKEVGFRYGWYSMNTTVHLLRCTVMQRLDDDIIANVRILNS